MSHGLNRNLKARRRHIAAVYLVSNTSDLVKWIKSVNQSFDFDGFTATNANHYYAGWNVYDDYVCHSGNNPNYSSQLIISRNGRVGVFALSSLSGSSATEAAENIYRMHLGESIKIGLYIDDGALLDFESIMAILILIYLMLLIQVNSKKKAIWSLLSGSIFIVRIVLFPFFSHYNYYFLYVWCPSSLLLFLLANACSSIIQICNSAVWLKCYKMRD